MSRRTKRNSGFSIKELVLRLVLLALAMALSFSFYYVQDNVVQKRVYAVPTTYQTIAESAAQQHGVSPALVLAVMKTESSFQPDAVSHAQAKGLMQLTDDTFNYVVMKSGMDYTIDQIFDPQVNIQCGTWYLAFLLERYDNNMSVALAAYNAGMGNVSRWLADPNYSADGKTLDKIPYTETANYVKKVTAAYETYVTMYQ